MGWGRLGPGESTPSAACRPANLPAHSPSHVVDTTAAVHSRRLLRAAGRVLALVAFLDGRADGRRDDGEHEPEHATPTAAEPGREPAAGGIDRRDELDDDVGVGRGLVAGSS